MRISDWSSDVCSAGYPAAAGLASGTCWISRNNGPWWHSGAAGRPAASQGNMGADASPYPFRFMNLLQWERAVAVATMTARERMAPGGGSALMRASGRDRKGGGSGKRVAG